MQDNNETGVSIIRPFGGKDGIYVIECMGCNTFHVVYTVKETSPNGQVWEFNQAMDKPTFSPSLLITYPDGRRCHSFIRNGQIQYLSDCTHYLAGKTINLPPVDA